MTERCAHVERFSEHIRRIFDRTDSSSFFRCESAFAELLDHDVARNGVRAALRQIADEPYRIGDWTLRQLVLDRGPAYTLSIALLDASTRFIHTSPCLAMYAPLGPSDLVCDRYRLPAGWNNAVFDPAVTLAFAGSDHVRTGQIIHVHPEGPICDFRVTAPQVMLKLASSPWHVLEWLFDRETLQARQANDSALTSTQLRVASYLLGRLGQASSVAPLRQLAESAVPSVRWAAIQNLGRLDSSAALQRLERATGDPHPHIARAAKRTLERHQPPIANP